MRGNKGKNAWTSSVFEGEGQWEGAKGRGRGEGEVISESREGCAVILVLTYSTVYRSGGSQGHEPERRVSYVEGRGGGLSRWQCQR